MAEVFFFSCSTSRSELWRLYSADAGIFPVVSDVNAMVVAIAEILFHPSVFGFAMGGQAALPGQKWREGEGRCLVSTERSTGFASAFEGSTRDREPTLPP